MRSFRSALLLCLVSWLAVLQTPAMQTPADSQKPAPSSPGVVRAVLVEGNKIYKTADIVQVLGIRRGEESSSAVFQAAQSRLLGTDLFSHVEYQFRWSGTNPAQYDVTYSVKEYDQLFPLHFEDLGVSDEALRKYLRNHLVMYQDAIPGTEQVIRRYTDAVQQFVAETKPTLKVRGFVSSEDPATPP